LSNTNLAFYSVGIVRLGCNISCSIYK